MNYTTHTLEENQKVAQDFISSLIPFSDQATIVGLFGNLGAGKTTFTQAVAKLLGVTEHVTSPTFILEKIYTINFKGFEKLIHIDAYRLDSGKDLLNLGWKEIADNPKNLILIEWPERIADILPPNIRKLSFTFVDETTREIEVS
jgi:tRNA threonylcarbamoyladenosine biosynthesis protein TsaE